MDRIHFLNAHSQPCLFVSCIVGRVNLLPSSTCSSGCELSGSTSCGWTALLRIIIITRTRNSAMGYVAYWRCRLAYRSLSPECHRATLLLHLFSSLLAEMKIILRLALALFPPSHLFYRSPSVTFRLICCFYPRPWHGLPRVALCL